MKRSLVLLFLTLWFWGLAAWLLLAPPDYLIGQPLVFYGFLFFIGGLLSAGFGLVESHESFKSLASKNKILLLMILFIILASLFPPDILRRYYPPAPTNAPRVPKSIIPFPIGLPGAGAACSNRCTVHVCVRWIPGPSQECPHPGPGGGCCTDYEDQCQEDCQDEDPPSPPSISGTVACGLWGSGGWCRSYARLALTASDPQGSSLTITGNAGSPFSCNGSCTIDLPTGSGTATYAATASGSGMSASGSSGWKYDPGLPAVSLDVSGTAGSNGWFISAVTVDASPSDAISGVSSTVHRMDGNPLQSGTGVTVSADGHHTVDFVVTDNAGNTVTASKSFDVDQTPPSSSFTSPDPATALRRTITIAGRSTDDTSGLASAEISVAGQAWQSLSVDGGDWTHTWDTTQLPNGTYTVAVRGLDVAGNREEATSLSLTIANLPPKVEIPPSWMIWDAAPVTIRSQLIPLKGAQIIVSDPLGRWPARRFSYEPGKAPDEFLWDRRFGDGTLAPPGSYRVEVEAWDVFGNTGRDAGHIIIPDVPVTTATMTATATVTAPPTPSPAPRRTRTPVAKAISTRPPIVEAQPTLTTLQPEVPLLFWPLASLAGWFVSLVAASLSDPRPQALRRLGKTIEELIQQNHYLQT